MSNRLLRFLMCGLFCLSLSAVTACGDDPEPEEGNNGPECTTNTDCGDDQICEDGLCVDDAPACTADEDCSTGEICTDAGECVGGCRADEDCSGDLVCLDDNSCGCSSDDQCGDGEVCQSNACEPVDVQCESAGDSCDSDSEVPAGSGFACLEDGDNDVCVTLCEAPAEGEPDPCASGSFCNVGQGSTTGYCYTSQCSSIGDDAGCDDEVAANPGRYPNDATCLAYLNDSFICVAAGEIAEGETCGEDVSGDCAQGLTCGFGGTCVSYCTDDDACMEGQSCIGDDTGEFARQSGWGICGNGCESYGAEGQCGEGLGCFPLTPEDGLCQETGDVEAYEACDVPDFFCDQSSDCPSAGDWTCNTDRGVCEQGCTATSECNDSEVCDIPDGETEGTCRIPAQCSEGSRCINLGDSTGRCMPVCNPTGDDQAAMDATCPVGNPTAYARFVHLAQSESEVDIYVNGTLVEDDFSVDAGTAGAIQRMFTEIATGDVTIEVVASDATDNSAPLASLDTTLVLNDQKTIAIVDLDTGLDIVELDVARNVAAPAAGEARFNLAHVAEVATAVDAYIIEDSATFLGTETADFTGLTFGDVTDFTGDLAAGDYVVHLFEAGETPLAAATNAVASLNVTLPADSIHTFQIWGTTALSATGVEYAEADMAANNGYCFNISSGEATVNSGACFERCTGPEAYGQGLCSESADTCSPFRSNHVCLPSDNSAVGESCDPTSLVGCEAGSYCRSLGQAGPGGSPTGVCAKQCVPGGSDNPVLGCPAAEACQPIGDEDFNFGQCGFACEATDFPSDFSSADCTEDFLMSCPPVEAGGQAFCAPSNDIAVGASCGEISTNNCVPNGVCRGSIPASDYIAVLVDPVSGVSGPSNDGGTCRQRCELFTDGASGCPSGQECWIDGNTLSTMTGYCVDAEADLADIGPLESCPAEHAGKACGDASMCSDFGDGTYGCFQWCDLEADTDTCSGGTSCQSLFDSNSITLGLCQP
jgi:phage baseplate assembly protein gpV